ncbi:MAG: tRNA threonylcarbamoyladenosine dehydratase [Spirochaetales bacterium]|nr:tRNA threonylcarbamoyladenosine dehydratase [Spirochaetales bacterium]
MGDQLERLRRLVGDEKIERLRNSKVIVFGIGGVGGYVVEALARSGVGELAIVDSDRICLSNLNRQIYALHSTMDELKVDVAEKRIHDINPDCKVTKYPVFYLPETAEQIDLTRFDYIVDCIDTITAKLELVSRADENKLNIISCMGTGNKLDPSKLQIADISKTSVCPLARVMRLELRKRGIHHLKCVFSTEEPIKTGMSEPGSTAFVPSVAGLMIASEVVRNLISDK